MSCRDVPSIREEDRIGRIQLNGSSVVLNSLGIVLLGKSLVTASTEMMRDTRIGAATQSEALLYKETRAASQKVSIR